MLYLTVEYKDGHQLDLPWHVGESWPLSTEDNSGRKVVQVQADGAELMAIWAAMPAIPKFTALQVVRYPNPWAELISLNSRALFCHVRK